MSRHYVSNSEFLELLKKYKELKNGGNEKELRIVKEKLGAIILLIAKRLSEYHIFSSYTWIDDMRSDGVLRSWMSVDNFDTSKSNPFAFFTKIIFRCFINRIKKEKKELYKEDSLHTLYEIEHELLN